MTRLRFLTPLALATLLWTGVQGQEQPTDKAALPMHFKKLGLSKDQEEKILKLRGEYDQKFAALRKQLQDLEVQERAAVEKLLTEPQKAKLKELREPPKDDGKGKDKK
jgi:hypothetical protein